MTGTKVVVKQTKATVVTNDHSKGQGRLKQVGGSQSDHWNNVLANQTVQTIWPNKSEDAHDRQRSATIAGLVGIGPKDEVEGMMAAQLIAAHNAAMECYRRAMLTGVSLLERQENLSQANKLSRTSATLLEALDRHRGKGQQKVTVEHVHVYQGGQAVVGVVPPGGGDQQRLDKQPHAKEIDYAPKPPVWSADKTQEPVPVAWDGEREVPDARRNVSGRTEGE
jgi:hypothetical protein